MEIPVFGDPDYMKPGVQNIETYLLGKDSKTIKTGKTFREIKFPSGDKVWPVIWLCAEDLIWGPKWDIWENYGGSPIVVSSISTSYTLKSISFTTGSTNTSATLCFFKWCNGTDVVYGDEFTFVKN